MPAAVAIPLITAAAGTAGSIIGASKQAGAAKQAAATQAASGQQAINALTPLVQQGLNAQTNAYQNAQQLYAPYTQLGTQSLAALMRGVGLSGGAPAVGGYGGGVTGGYPVAMGGAYGAAMPGGAYGSGVRRMVPLSQVAAYGAGGQ